MLKFKIGDSLKENVDGKVFTVAGLTKKTATLPQGWPTDNTGRPVNPRFCELHKSAILIGV